MNTKNFFEQAKKNAEAKAKKMAAIELQCWNAKHEHELVNYFGFTAEKLTARKKELQNIVAK